MVTPIRIKIVDLKMITAIFFMSENKCKYLVALPGVLYANNQTILGNFTQFC
jgi:hypothetical protein